MQKLTTQCGFTFRENTQSSFQFKLRRRQRKGVPLGCVILFSGKNKWLEELLLDINKHNYTKTVLCSAAQASECECFSLDLQRIVCSFYQNNWMKNDNCKHFHTGPSIPNAKVKLSYWGAILIVFKLMFQVKCLVLLKVFISQ